MPNHPLRRRLVGNGDQDADRIGTRKHPVKVTAPKRKQSAGLTNPLQLLTNKNMFAASTFSDMNLNEKIVGSAVYAHR